jgi:voltage-gated potassium channel
VTTEGRVIAVLLMVVGIGTLGAVTASVAAWMVRQVQLEDAARQSGIERGHDAHRTA